MFDLHLLHLPPLNLLNIHLYYSETNYERAMKSPFCVCGKEAGDEECLRDFWEERRERMKEMVRGR